MSEAHKASERWTIDINNGRFIFCREVNGKPAGSYCPVGKDLAAIYAIAILNGFEPPRHLKEIDGDFIERQVSHSTSCRSASVDKTERDAAIKNAVSNALIPSPGTRTYDDGAINEKAQSLLGFLERLERSANHGLELNLNREPSIPAEKMISAEQCEWVLKDCALFRSAIFDAFGLPQ